MGTAAVSERTACIRCGECCLGAAPSLHVQDIRRVTAGPIRKTDIYTIRVGELVRDNIHGELQITPDEFIKVRERPDRRGCTFYDAPGKRCTIYEDRPSQCAAMECWDETGFMRVYGEPKATRKDLIQDHNLLRLMAAHDERCAYERLGRYVREIERAGNRAVQAILEMLKFDHDIRRLAPEKLAVGPEEMDLIFGRPLAETIGMFGLKVTPTPDGTFFLTLKEPVPPDR